MQQADVVTYHDIASMRDRAGQLKSLDMGQGGAAAVRTAIAQGKEAKRLMSLDCPTQFRQARDEQCAYMGTNVGFALHDAGHESEASSWWNFATEAAGQSDNWSIIARVWGQSARQQLALGRPKPAVALTDAALEGDDRGELLPIEKAMLYALQARGYGAMGDATATTVAIAKAQGYWGEVLPHDDDGSRPWIGHFDLAHLWGDIGAAWRELAAQGGRSAAHAIGAYEQASLAHGTEPRSRRSAALVACSQATLEASYGDLERSVKIGNQAIDLGGQVRSRRLTGHYTELHGALKPYEGRHDVAELLHRIRSSVIS